MKDIEDFIKGNKSGFDVEGPSGQLWGKIEQGLNQQKIRKTTKYGFWFGVAASVAMVAGLFCFYKFYGEGRRAEFSSVNPGYAKNEMKFASLIEEKKDSLQMYAKDNPGLYQKFNEDLKALDQDYVQLKKELENSPDQRVVIRAMAQNLETQLQIVSQQLSVISQADHYKRAHQL